MSIQRIPLTWATPPTTANKALRSTNPGARAAAVRNIRDQAIYAIRNARPQPVKAAEVTLCYRPADKRLRDADGMFPLLKACLDAAVTEGVLPADDWRHVPAATCRIVTPSDRASMWLELRAVAVRGDS